MICSLIPSNIELVEKKGRFREERNIEVYLKTESSRKRLLVMKVFNGRPPYYKKWIEVFAISREYSVNSETILFKDSYFENWVLDCISEYIGPGEYIFIETLYDSETEELIERGVPVVLTRLGYNLLERGYTWFKPWYYPEGFMEGSTKIQAQKPLSNEHGNKNINEICKEISESYDQIIGKQELKAVETSLYNALERYQEIRRKYCD